MIYQHPDLMLMHDEAMSCSICGTPRAYIEKMKEYVKLLTEELDELASLAALHGWKSTRFEEGKRLRKELGIG